MNNKLVATVAGVIGGLATAVELYFGFKASKEEQKSLDEQIDAKVEAAVKVEVERLKLEGEA